MRSEPNSGTETASFNAIRVETVLSRYPIHRLARKGNIDIDIREEDQDGEVVIQWEVDYSKKHGQPGPLAYKLDTLIVNRRIEEAIRPIPKLIRLGSLRDICRELGLTEGENVATIRKALRQNAFAGITAKIRYREADGSERTLEADFTRYSVIFTGEELPDGRKADAVYLILNDIFMQVINGAMVRPLDYDYLRSLPPAPHRLYELLSYQMYAALKNDRPRAKLTYSHFCIYAPQTRYFDWERARRQMAKVLAPHRESGYIAEVEYQQAADSDGRPDWIMLFTPGAKAQAEHRAFAKRGGPSQIGIGPPSRIVPEVFRPDPARLPLEVESPLMTELTTRGVTRAAVAGLVQRHPAEEIEHKLEVFDWLMEKQDKRVARSPAGYLVKSITDDYATPKGFESKAARQARSEAKQQADREAAEGRRRQREQSARDLAQQQAVDAYLRRLTSAERTALEAEALARAALEARQGYEEAPARYRATLLQGLVREHMARELVRRSIPTEA
jgi:hypothetical protein